MMMTVMMMMMMVMSTVDYHKSESAPRRTRNGNSSGKHAPKIHEYTCKAKAQLEMDAKDVTDKITAEVAEARQLHDDVFLLILLRTTLGSLTGSTAHDDDEVLFEGSEVFPRILCRFARGSSTSANPS